MSEMSEYQRSVIRTCKGLEANDSGAGFETEIAVVNEKNERIGSLRPLDCHLADDEGVVNSLTVWRRRFGRFFFTQFEPTDERTKSWLNNVVLKDDTRLLFLVKDAAGRPVGNLGACSITGESAELDNFIRGERGGDPKLMLLSGLSLVGWIYGALNIEKIHARVIANNFRTLSVYEATGCFDRGEVPEPLQEVADDGNAGGPAAPDAQASREEIRFVKMTLDVQKFLSRYPWMANPLSRRVKAPN